MNWLRVYIGIFFLFLFAPIVLVVVFSFNTQRSVQRLDGLGLD